MIYLGFKLIIGSVCAAAPARVEVTDNPVNVNQKELFKNG